MISPSLITKFRNGAIIASRTKRSFSAATSYPNSVRIVEVGPRDGLQNEKGIIPLEVKLEFIRKLSKSGLQVVEAGSFVSPKWVPQMADSEDIFKYISTQKASNSNAQLQTDNVIFSALTPNMKGLETVLSTGTGVEEVSVFGAASEAFSQKNINCSIAESLQRFEPVAKHALESGVRVRGYVSCVLGCPYSGHVDPAAVAEVTHRLIDMGCYEISLGDTIGVGTTGSTAMLLEHIIEKAHVDPKILAAHFHDTYGQALANLHVALSHGVEVIDSSVSGLGGCPYAGGGASGNVATEDVLYMLHDSGVRTGVDIEAILDASAFIDAALGRSTASKVVAAERAKRSRDQC